MKERVVSAMIMLPLLILLIIKGIPLYLAGVALMVIALHEFYVAFETIDYHPIKIIGYLFAIFLFFANLFYFSVNLIALAVFLLFLVSTLLVLNHKNTPVDVCITFAGIGYICIFFEYIIKIVNNIPDGGIYVWLVFLIAFSTDIFAYLVGRQFGKHKLMPKVSPKKTIEGSLGGIIASFVFTFIFGLVFKMPLSIIFILGIFGSMIAQLGDLTASSIKRYVGIKDFGRIIPGHGGVLDRFDSVLLVSPFVYFIFGLLS